MLLKDLVISPFNVRLTKNDEDLDNLRDSIKDNTLINKIILRPGKAGKFEVVDGQRRYKALLELLGEDAELPEQDYVLMTELDDEHAYLLSISENTQRLALSPLELNKIILKLNGWGYKEKEIAKIINVTPHRLKRLSTLGQDLKHIPEVAQKELWKPVEESSFSDAHWEKLRDVDNEDVVKDVVDYIIDKETPARDVPAVIKAIEKQYEKENPLPSDSSKEPSDSDSPPADGPIEYTHKGELVLELHGDEKILKVLGKGTENESEIVPVDHYLEYLSHPEKFRCYVTFKLKIKPVE